MSWLTILPVSTPLPGWWEISPKLSCSSPHGCGIALERRPRSSFWERTGRERVKLVLNRFRKVPGFHECRCRDGLRREIVMACAEPIFRDV